MWKIRYHFSRSSCGAGLGFGVFCNMQFSSAECEMHFLRCLARLQAMASSFFGMA